jgi:hypothetical protein
VMGDAAGAPLLVKRARYHPGVPGGPAETGAGGRVPVPGPLPHLPRHRLHLNQFNLSK